MTLRQIINHPVKADNLIVFTFVLHLLLLTAASAVPEGQFLFWMPINLTVEAIILLRLILLWRRYSKHEPRRYNSLQLYWMLIGFSIFTTMPFVRMSHGSVVFWPLLIGTLFLFLLGHHWKERIGEVFVNPRKQKQLVMWPTALAGIILVGIVVMTVLRFQSVDENVGMAVLLYMLGVFSILIANPFSLPKERVEKLMGD